MVKNYIIDFFPTPSISTTSVVPTSITAPIVGAVVGVLVLFCLVVIVTILVSLVVRKRKADKLIITVSTLQVNIISVIFCMTILYTAHTRMSTVN